MATRLTPTTFGYQNFYSAVLTADMTSIVLTASLDSVPTPSSGILVIDPDSSTSREVVLYTSKGASTVTFPADGRGYSGSTAAAHLTGTTVIMAPIDKWFTALASGELSTDPIRTELINGNSVVSGLIWTADSAGSTRNATMSSGVIYINGRRLTGVAVTSRSFTASKDTYIDASDATSDGVITLTYTEVANNAASPTLAANNVRIGIVVTGVASIAAASSINQGSPWASLPTTTSSVPLAVCDTIGNLIYPRPNQKLIGMRVYPTGAGPSQASASLIALNAGLNVPVLLANVPNGGNIYAAVATRSLTASAGTGDMQLCLGSVAGQSFADVSVGATSTALSGTVASGFVQVTANTSVVPAVVCTGGGTVSVQAFNNSLYVAVSVA